MNYKLSRSNIIRLTNKAKKIKNVNDLTETIFDDARIIFVFRLNEGLDRKEFSKMLGKSIKTISNLENGTKLITSLLKAKKYAEALKKLLRNQLNEKRVTKNLESWKRKIETDRIIRAKRIAHLGGLSAAKKLDENQKFLRAKIAGLAASKKSVGIHRYKRKWMLWSKKGLRNAGRKTCK